MTALLFTLPGYRDSYETSIGTLDRVLRATDFTYRRLYRMCRERDQERRVDFARVLIEEYLSRRAQKTRGVLCRPSCIFGTTGGR